MALLPKFFKSDFNKCFLKEIGILMYFIVRKSDKIVKIEILVHKRHLPKISLKMNIQCILNDLIAH